MPWLSAKSLQKQSKSLKTSYAFILPWQLSLWLSLYYTQTHTHTSKINYLAMLLSQTFILQKLSISYLTHKYSWHATVYTLCTEFTVIGRTLNCKRRYFSNRRNKVKQEDLRSPLFTCCDCFFLLASNVSGCEPHADEEDGQTVNRN